MVGGSMRRMPSRGGLEAVTRVDALELLRVVSVELREGAGLDVVPGLRNESSKRSARRRASSTKSRRAHLGVAVAVPDDILVASEAGEVCKVSQA